ncbi:hypothetical protein [Streptomyces lasiicapitis]|uniref:hypothetical protein n=1 Tax=Streptomyces lasiicapitis TaxID=1923961 RepID=UPI003658C050
MHTTRSAVTLAVTAALALALLATGCDSSSPDKEPDSAGATLPAREFAGGENWEKGPAKPKRGKWYPYDMLAHCGVEFARFGGRGWKLERVHTTSGSQVKGERPRGAWVLPGYMALMGPDEASFEAAGLPAMDFVPTKDAPPNCA